MTTGEPEVDDHHDEDSVGEVVLASEQVELVSAGIDIGSATSHLMLSRLVLRRRGLNLSSGFEVVRREVIYRSPVLLTPYVDPTSIDATALRTFIDASYAEAGVAPDEIDTGAVIVTGEAARKKNARAISELFARHSGRFVCAVAGPLLEARLAVHGSGAAAISAAGSVVVNLDIGGGTTKASLVRDGRIEQVMVVSVGARLLAFDEAGVLTRVEAPGVRAARACDAAHRLGARLTPEDRDKVADWLTDRLFGYLTGIDPRADGHGLYVAGVPFVVPPGATLIASGGVGEYVYGLESAGYGDLGDRLGAAVRARLDAWSGRELLAGSQRLRSTVIGASQYTVQVSGNTIFVADPSALPLHNLPVVHVHVHEPVPDEDAVAAAVRAALDRVDGARDVPALALACHTRLVLSHAALRAFAAGLARGCGPAPPATLTVLLEQDCAGLLGHLLRPQIAVHNLLCIDQVAVDDLDFVDVGRIVPLAEAVPVIAKSLIFSG